MDKSRKRKIRRNYSRNRREKTPISQAAAKQRSERAGQYVIVIVNAFFVTKREYGLSMIPSIFANIIFLIPDNRMQPRNIFDYLQLNALRMSLIQQQLLQLCAQIW